VGDASSAGGSDKVRVKISSRTGCGIVGGLPERRASARPANPRSAYRDRHNTTVGSEHPTRAAISLPATPSAANSTIRARSTTRAGAPFDRARRINSSRSSAATASTRT
jgi:hypothetical protein